jgi:hypothetical protein
MTCNKVAPRSCGILFLCASVGFPWSCAFASCSSTLSGTTATVTCTAATDQIVISQVFGAWNHTGASTFGTDQFDWDSTTAGEQSLLAGGAIDFASLGGGNLAVGDTTNTAADALKGTVTVSHSGAASAQVTLDSSISTTANTYNVNDASGPTTVNMLTFNANSTTGEGLTIITGTAADTVNVLSVFGTDTITVQGNSGADHVNVGVAGSVQSIMGPTTIRNDSSLSTITIDDSADSAGRTGTITSDSVTGAITGIAPAAINWVVTDVAGVTLNNGAGNDTLNVLATDPGVPVSIQGTNGLDQVNIGNAGSVQGIAGALTIANTLSFTNLLINDSADTTARTAAYTSTGVTGVAPAAINWVATDISGVMLTMGTGADTVNVLSSAPFSALTIRGTDGADQVNVGNTGSVQSIQGTVDILNFFNFTTVVIDDSADATGREATYTSTGVSGVGPAAIMWSDSDVKSITVNLGSGADIVHVLGSASNNSLSVATSINLGNGNNQCFINGFALGASSSNAISGGSGDDLFVISAVPTNVTSVDIIGGSQSVADEIIYTSGTVSGAFPGNGTLVPTNLNAHSIGYNSIELFSIDDTIFIGDFE